MAEWRSSPPFYAHVGLQLDAIGDGRATIRLPCDKHLGNSRGEMHGGAMATMADAAMSQAVRSTIPLGSAVATITMTLNYQVASTAAGPIGQGLQPGTCAWADRTDAAAEPGKIKFLTARNAQREQEKSGGVVDSSATAAERWPDLRTIPAYMTDPSHYWTFNVSLTDPDSAIRHAAWLPTAPEAPDS